ncbi:MAG: electron transfer flavoprotein subunit beta/FixA family protein [Deltaproteobacteria bacterium]|nr:electron transfer flavoprotein subunit beta/FixA family protein [Deltaproteobacteria bacterium]
MDIKVLIKQVPNTSEVKIDPHTGTLMREGMESIINPDDLHAIEAALQLRDTHGGKVTAISMGPPQAKDVLREALGMGVDECILLTDRAFAGADTLATSYTLGKCVLRLGRFDLVIAGHQAIDGDTAQIGPQVAEFLGIPQVIRAIRLEIRGDGLLAERTAEEGTEIVKSTLPALVTVTKEANDPRYLFVPLLMAAFEEDAPIRVWGGNDIGADEAGTGLKGSPTRVRRTFTPSHNKKIERLNGMPADMARTLVERLRERKVI